MESRNSFCYLQELPACRCRYSDAACRCRYSDESNLHAAYILIVRFILYLHLRLGLSNGPFPSEFPSKNLYGFHFSPRYVTSRATHLPLIDHPNNIK